MSKGFASTLFAMGFAIVCSTMITMAQTAKDLVGTWELVSIVNTAKDSTKTDPFGPNPKGILILGQDGRYAIIMTRPDLPKFASDNRLQGTPDENKAIVHGSFANFGTYSVANEVLTLHSEGSTWPSLIGADQKLPIISYAENQLTWTVPATIGGSNVVTWRRVK